MIETVATAYNRASSYEDLSFLVHDYVERFLACMPQARCESEDVASRRPYGVASGLLRGLLFWPGGGVCFVVFSFHSAVRIGTRTCMPGSSTVPCNASSRQVAIEAYPPLCS